jgi:hypothetical protein
MMKVIKKKAQPTLKEQFQVGTRIVWHKMFFDGRVSERVNYSGVVVKVNRVTVDVIMENGDTVRLDDWELGTAHTEQLPAK